MASDKESLAASELQVAERSLLADSQLNRRLLRKIDWRFLPIATTAYLANTLDRSNIGNAKIMNKEDGHDLLTTISLSESQYRIAIMMFMITYSLFQVPSNAIIQRVKPSLWIGFLVASWGVVSIGISGVQNFAGLIVLRLLLGVFDAGFACGVEFCMTFWYLPDERSFRMAIFTCAAPISNAVGGFLAYGIAHMEGIRGLEGWRWLFILEGTPTVLIGLLFWLIFPDFPETVRWLTEEERLLGSARMKIHGSHASEESLTWGALIETVVDWRLWMHWLAYLCISVPFGSLSIFTPTIIAGLGHTSLQAQLMTVPPYAAATVVMLLIAYGADKFNKRGLFVAAATLIGASGFVMSACLPPDAYSKRYGALMLAAAGSYSCLSPLNAWLSCNMRSTSTTGLSIAAQISFGAYGQIIGAWVYEDKETSEGFPVGHWVNAGALLLATVLCCSLHLLYYTRNRALQKGELDWKL